MIGLCSVLHPSQHSIGYTGDGFFLNVQFLRYLLRNNYKFLMMICLQFTSRSVTMV